MSLVEAISENDHQLCCSLHIYCVSVCSFSFRIHNVTVLLHHRYQLLFQSADFNEKSLTNPTVHNLHQTAKFHVVKIVEHLTAK